MFTRVKQYPSVVEGY